MTAKTIQQYGAACQKAAVGATACPEACVRVGMAIGDNAACAAAVGKLTSPTAQAAVDEACAPDVKELLPPKKPAAKKPAAKNPALNPKASKKGKKVKPGGKIPRVL